MVGCHDLKKGDKIKCPDCGIVLEVTEVCEECNDTSCGCEHDCNFECCGTPLEKI